MSLPKLVTSTHLCVCALCITSTLYCTKAANHDLLPLTKLLYVVTIFQQCRSYNIRCWMCIQLGYLLLIYSEHLPVCVHSDNSSLVIVWTLFCVPWLE